MGLSFGDIMGSVLKAGAAGLDKYGAYKEANSPEALAKAKEGQQMTMIKLALDGLSGKYGDKFMANIGSMGLDPNATPNDWLKSVFTQIGRNRGGATPRRKVVTSQPVPTAQPETGWWDSVKGMFRSDDDTID